MLDELEGKKRPNYKKGTTLDTFHLKLVWGNKQHIKWSKLVQPTR